MLLQHSVDRAVIATATELFGARHYPGVVAMCSDALENEPECVPLLVVRARAWMALRRDLDAQADLRDIIRLEPGCGIAYRLLGELAARRDEHASAAVFFREALRLDPGDREASDWLMIVTAPSRPAAEAHQLPASASAAGHFSSRARSAEAAQPRFARGTQPLDPAEERPTRPFRAADPGSAAASPSPPGPTSRSVPPRIVPRPTARGPMPELPGFGEYLVAAGILTLERLRAAQAYQRSMKVQLSTAIVTLGLASPQRLEWAAVAHQSQLARDRALS